jgi:hypothetical protein
MQSHVMEPKPAPPEPAGGELIPIPQWPHAWPSKAGWRHLVAASSENGLRDCGALVRAPGRRGRWLIDPTRFWEWCRARQNGEAA